MVIQTDLEKDFWTREKWSVPVLQSQICKLGSFLKGTKVTIQLFNGEISTATTFGSSKWKRSWFLNIKMVYNTNTVSYQTNEYHWLPYTSKDFHLYSK